MYADCNIFRHCCQYCIAYKPGDKGSSCDYSGIIRSSYGPAWRDMQSSHAEV